MATKTKDRQRSTAAGLWAPVLKPLEGLSIDELRREWAQRFASEPPPKIRSSEFLRQLLGWKLQGDAIGGLDAETRHTLQTIASALEKDSSYEPKVRHRLTPGLILTREWKGVMHRVTVIYGGFQHAGRQYKSLSDIARSITGTRWSGPRFFGLEQKIARPPKPVVSQSAEAKV
jgi:hypothetical protein